MTHHFTEMKWSIIRYVSSLFSVTAGGVGGGWMADGCKSAAAVDRSAGSCGWKRARGVQDYVSSKYHTVINNFPTPGSRTMNTSIEHRAPLFLPNTSWSCLIQ